MDFLVLWQRRTQTWLPVSERVAALVAHLPEGAGREVPGLLRFLPGEAGRPVSGCRQGRRRQGCLPSCVGITTRRRICQTTAYSVAMREDREQRSKGAEEQGRWGDGGEQGDKVQRKQESRRKRQRGGAGGRGAREQGSKRDKEMG